MGCKGGDDPSHWIAEKCVVLQLWCGICQVGIGSNAMSGETANPFSNPAKVPVVGCPDEFPVGA